MPVEHEVEVGSTRTRTVPAWITTRCRSITGQHEVNVEVERYDEHEVEKVEQVAGRASSVHASASA